MKHRAKLAAMIGSRRLIRSLLKLYPEDYIAKKLTGNELRSLKCNEKAIETFLKEQKEKDGNHEQEKLHTIHAQILIPGEEEYPPLLNYVQTPPLFLYKKGDRQKEYPYTLAVVGSRKMSPYGEKITTMLIKDLINENIPIISGLAHGVDALSHQQTLSHKGVARAVMGCGIDMIYPRTNTNLACKILASGGAIYSEFPPGYPPRPQNFPARNRIIAGMSHGTLVIQAAKRSGSLITAEFALDYGRDVYTVPGNILDKTISGSNDLIAKGAHCITSPKDLLDHVQNAIPIYTL